MQRGTSEIKGLYTAEVEYKGELFNLPVHVVRRSQQPNLLGRNWINCLKMKAVHIRNIETTPPELQALIEKRSALFKEDSGLNYTGPCARFEFKKDSNPRFFRARPVPYALAAKVEEEIDRLLKQGILEKVHYSEWAAPIVPVLKGDGTVRICGDYKLTVNQVTRTNPYPKTSMLHSRGGGATVHDTGLKACL